MQRIQIISKGKSVRIEKDEEEWGGLFYVILSGFTCRAEEYHYNFSKGERSHA
jgi:hypothetical protein